jgi:branched-chain amino acid transport system permease protein
MSEQASVGIRFHVAIRRSKLLRAGAALLVLVGWPLVIRGNYLVYIATLVCLYAIGAMSLHLILRMGQVSLGHAAFMGLGGYTSAVLVTAADLPFVLGLFAGGAVAGMLAGLIGPILLRLKGVYFVLVTFTLGEIVRLVFVEWISVTGGSSGIYQIPAPAPLFLDLTAYYYLALAAAMLVGLFCNRLLSSDIGRAMQAMRESESLAEANGIPILRIKVVMFVVAAVLVGFQGSLEAHFIRYISPLSYDFSESLRFLVMNVIGGLNSLAGPILGALFLVVLPEMLRGWVEIQWVLYGIALILIIRYVPGGLVDFAARILAFLMAPRQVGVS